MDGGFSISLHDELDGLVLVLTDPDGSRVHVGPILRMNAAGDTPRACADTVFPASDAGNPSELIESSLTRAEQLVLDKMYAGKGSARDAAHARVVVLWAAMTIRALAELAAGPTPDPSTERRIEHLIALARHDGVAPLTLSEPAPIAETAPGPSGKRGMASRIAAHVRASRLRAADGALPPGREIALQPFQNRWAIFNEIGAGIAFTTFASAGSFVFLGVRLQKCSGLCNAGGITGFSASLDIIALVICSFGFLFATLSYANATGVLARSSTMSYQEALERGNRVSEYFGVYPLIFAIPLAVEGSTSSPIPLIVKLVGLVAFFGYHWSPSFSLLERVIADDALGSERARRLTVLFLVGLLGLVWFGPNIDAGDGGLWIRVVASGCFLGAICVIYGIASLIPEQASLSAYRVHPEDVLNEESPSLEDLQPFERS